MQESSGYEKQLEALRQRIIDTMGADGIYEMAAIDRRIDEQIQRRKENAERVRVMAEAEAKAYNQSQGTREGMNCPKCKNRGDYMAVRSTYRVIVECECMRAREAVKNLKRSGLMGMIKQFRMDNFVTDKPHTKLMMQTAKRFLSGNGWMYMGGQVGSGKTHICTAVCGELLKSNHAVLYMLWRDESVKLKGMVNDPDYGYEIGRFKTAEILYIDDFLKVKKGERPSAADINIAFEIINSRYNNQRRTILSSEWAIDHVMGFDEALGSRIYQMTTGNVVEIGKDENKNWRLKA